MRSALTTPSTELPSRSVSVNVHQHEVVALAELREHLARDVPGGAGDEHFHLCHGKSPNMVG